MKRNRNTVMIILGALGAATVAAGLVILGLWNLAIGMSHDRLAIWALATTIAIPVVFWSAYYLGRVEARGFLSGIDAGLSRVARLVDVRDNSRLTVQAAVTQPRPQPAAPAGPPPVLLPNPDYPQIRHRAPSGGEVIDL